MILGPESGTRRTEYNSQVPSAAAPVADKPPVFRLDQPVESLATGFSFLNNLRSNARDASNSVITGLGSWLTTPSGPNGTVAPRYQGGIRGAVAPATQPLAPQADRGPERPGMLQQPSLDSSGRVTDYSYAPLPTATVKDTVKPVPKGGSKERYSKPKTKSDLADYTYTLSDLEFDRVSEGNPSAEKTVSTDPRLKSLTWEQYNALSKQQQAAVQFNSLLIQAREKDLRFPKSYTEEAMAEYSSDVDAMFGVDGGSEATAINTVELLKKIDFKAVGQDLDEFLSLDRGFTMKELKDFKFSKDDLKELEHMTFGAEKDYGSVRTPENMAALDTTQVRKALDAYKEVLTKDMNFDTPQVNAWSMVDALGPQDEWKKATVPGGYRAAPTGTDVNYVDQSLRGIYELLRKQPNKEGMALLAQDFQDRNWTEEDKQMLWNYIDTRSKNELMTGAGKDATKIRAILGWE